MTSARVAKDIALVLAEANRLTEKLAESEDAMEALEVEEEICHLLSASSEGVDTLYLTLRNLQAKADHYKELAKELSKKATSILASKDRLEDIVLGMVEDEMLPAKLIGDTYRISACRNSVPSLNITKEQEDDLIYAGYCRTKVELDKRAVVEGLLNGEIPGYDIDEVLVKGTHLRLSK